MQGRDMIGRARTGTGKTLAFGIPILDKIIQFNAKHGRGRILWLWCWLRRENLQSKLTRNSMRQHRVWIRFVCMVVHPLEGRWASLTMVLMWRLAHLAVLLISLRGVILEVQSGVLDEADQMLQVGFQEDVEIMLERLTKKS